MKRLIPLLLVFVVSVSCQDSKTQNFDVSQLNGYWEIEQVTLADGSKKDYDMNEDIDFFEVKKDSGFRKKVKPQFDGTYVVNDAYEKIKIIKSKEGTFISYQTDYATWKEQIVALTKDQLILENQQKVKYQYKKPIPFSVK